MRHWDHWRERTGRGASPAEFLAECSDETLVELLAYGQGGTPVERNVIATELTNRLSRLQRNVAGHSARVRGLVDENRRALADAGQADEDIRREVDAHEAESAKTSRVSGTRNADGW